jgi:DNA-binding transcriptional MerR regulator
MRISELSERTGVSVPTIKYYIREGLLPRGAPTASNQADYSERHVERLRLIRILREVAGLPVATIGEVLAALDQPGAAAMGEHVATAVGSLARSHGSASPEAVAAVEELVEARGWDVDPTSGGFRDLAAALTGLEEHWGDHSPETLQGYAAVAERLAEMEIPDGWQPGSAEALTYAVLGTILFEPVILALRRMAHENRHKRLVRSAASS